MDSVDRKTPDIYLDLNTSKNHVKKTLNLLSDRKTTVQTPNTEGRTFFK